MMNLTNILKSLLKESVNQLPKFIYSHSFINDAGQRVTQYKMSDGFGGYARITHLKDGFEMTNIIMDEELRGKGIGTTFYIQMNQESVKETGNPLQSIKPDKTGTVELSSDGRQLWDSLVRKGLAKKINRDRYKFKK